MLITLLSVVYVLIAVAMIVLILLQRGAGAAAGSGFGGGASATVFGARGSANFLSKSTAVLATLFFLISIAMAMIAQRSAQPAAADDLGVMGAMEQAAPSSTSSELPSAVSAPGAESGEIPSPAEAASEVPATPVAAQPEAEVQPEAQDEPATE